MKLKYFLLFAFVGFFSSLKAQMQVPNTNFESWSSDLAPDGFSTLETIYSNVPHHFAFKSTDKHEGNYSLKLVSDTATIIPAGGGAGVLDTLIGFATAGPATPSGANISLQGVPFVGKPDTIHFAYKYLTPNGTDTATITVGMKNGATDVLPTGTIKLDSTSKWKYLYVVLKGHYSGTISPDHIFLTFSSSMNTAKTPLKLGSTFYIDRVRFGYNPTGVNDITSAGYIHVFPNPASSMLNVNFGINSQGFNFRVFDVTGKLVISKVLEQTSNMVSIADLTNGTYFYQVTDKNEAIIDRNKIVVVK